jgi:hypothetical protein
MRAQPILSLLRCRASECGDDRGAEDERVSTLLADREIAVELGVARG